MMQTINFLKPVVCLCRWLLLPANARRMWTAPRSLGCCGMYHSCWVTKRRVLIGTESSASCLTLWCILTLVGWPSTMQNSRSAFPSNLSNSPGQNACHHILTGLHLSAMILLDTHIHRTWGKQCLTHSFLIDNATAQVPWSFLFVFCIELVGSSAPKC